VWDNWFGETISRDGTEAHSGTKSLKIDVEGTFWGVQWSNSPGFPTIPGLKTASFWAKGSYVNSNVGSLAIKWIDDVGAVLQTDTIPITNLTSAWQEFSADIAAPAGAVDVYVTVTSNSGTDGDVIYLDDVIIGDRS
jgi:hypothetical protein